jgi:hypothetical protein
MPAMLQEIATQSSALQNFSTIASSIFKLVSDIFLPALTPGANIRFVKLSLFLPHGKEMK